jgi:hypothetical protein
LIFNFVLIPNCALLPLPPTDIIFLDLLGVVTAHKAGKVVIAESFNTVLVSTNF